MIFKITLTLAYSSFTLLNDSSNDCVKYNAYVYRERMMYTFSHIKRCINPRHQYQLEGRRPKGWYCSKADKRFNMENGICIVIHVFITYLEITYQRYYLCQSMPKLNSMKT